jgi:hypothetical protein
VGAVCFSPQIDALYICILIAKKRQKNNLQGEAFTGLSHGKEPHPGAASTPFEKFPFSSLTL